MDPQYSLIVTKVRYHVNYHSSILFSFKDISSASNLPFPGENVNNCTTRAIVLPGTSTHTPVTISDYRSSPSACDAYLVSESCPTLCNSLYYSLLSSPSSFPVSLNETRPDTHSELSLTNSEMGGKRAEHNQGPDKNWLEPTRSKMVEDLTSSGPWTTCYPHCNTVACWMTHHQSVPRLTVKDQKVDSGPVSGNLNCFSQIVETILLPICLWN